MRNNAIVNKVTLCLLVLVSSASAAEFNFQADCDAVNSDYKLIESLTDSGELRYVNEVEKDNLPVFNFNIENEYSLYLNYTRNLIDAINPRANQPCQSQTGTYQQLAAQNNWTAEPNVGDLLAPFELTNESGNRGILLIHGLSDSPFHFHDLAQYFYQQGFTVRTLLLPGHATAPSDLLDVTYQQWQQAADYGINRMLKDFDQVYLGGFSTGGALILNHVMQKQDVDSKIKGILLWSPASKIKSNMAWALKYLDWVPFLDWLDKEADADFAKYESFPINAGAQVHELINHVNGENKNLTRNMQNIPLFVVVSEVDQTIDAQATMNILSEWHNPEDRPKTAKDMIVFYGDASFARSVLPDSIRLVTPNCNEDQLCSEVLNVAHTATTNAPSNLHYGETGVYRNCGHYLTDKQLFKQCKLDKDIHVGEKTAGNLAMNKAMHRLTYNPYFSEMLESIGQFLTVTQQD